MTRKVAVIGVGCVKVGELWDKSLKDLALESALRSLDKLGFSKVDILYVANGLSQMLQGQGDLGALIADDLGFNGIEALSIEAGEASGGLCFHEAVKSVSSGKAEAVLVTGVEKMSDVSTEVAVKAMMASEEQEYVAFTGVTPHGLHALIMRLYMDRFKAKHEDIAQFAVNAHKNAANNPYAQFRNSVTVEEVLGSSPLADPLTLLESSTVADGSASIVLTPLETAKNFTDTPIEVSASTTATDLMILPEREDMLTFNATQKAAEKAFREASLSRNDIDLVETHDSSTILGVVSLEDLGFVEKGSGASFVSDGGISIDGKLPTNCMGGLKGRGHPVGATGIYQLVELVWQLRNDAGKNQVKNANIGLALNLNCVGSHASVTILRRP